MATIGVDIGHGSNTFPPSKGVYKNGVAYHEHDANSRVAKRLAAKLKDAGHTVVQAQGAGKYDKHLTTRTTYYFDKNVDLIVSCHANAGVASADGYASFYWHDDSKAKKLSDLYAEEIKSQGFSLWGGSRPSKPNDWSNFHMCRVPASNGVPSILLENGFMTNADDFEWVFGAHKDEYAERCATAAFNAIQRFLGKSTEQKTEPAPEQQTNPAMVSKPKVSAKKANLKVDGVWGSATTKALQIALGTPADGVISSQYRNDVTEAIVSGITFGNDGSLVVRTLQRKIGAKADGFLGPNTVRKLQAYLGTPQDGVISDPSMMVRELQRRLNAGTF